MKDFLMFRSFVAHNLVKVFFYLVLAAQLVAALFLPIFAFVQEGFGAAIGMAILGLVFFVIYGILLRVGCEMMIVIFEIYDELKSIRRSLEGERVDSGRDGLR